MTKQEKVYVVSVIIVVLFAFFRFLGASFLAFHLFGIYLDLGDFSSIFHDSLLVVNILLFGLSIWGGWLIFAKKTMGRLVKWVFVLSIVTLLLGMAVYAFRVYTINNLILMPPGPFLER